MQPSQPKPASTRGEADVSFSRGREAGLGSKEGRPGMCLEALRARGRVPRSKSSCSPSVGVVERRFVWGDKRRYIPFSATLYGLRVSHAVWMGRRSRRVSVYPSNRHGRAASEPAVVCTCAKPSRRHRGGAKILLTAPLTVKRGHTHFVIQGST